MMVVLMEIIIINHTVPRPGTVGVHVCILMAPNTPSGETGSSLIGIHVT